jgi:hypothetical protein
MSSSESACRQPGERSFRGTASKSTQDDAALPEPNAVIVRRGPTGATRHPRRWVLGALLVALALGPLGCAMVDRLSGESENRQIRQVGVPAEAQVLRIWETGVRINDDPVVGFELEVYPEGKEPYRAETKALISILFIPQIQPGSRLPVKVDPNDPQRVALDIYEEP